jgi:hypothetical protein
VSTSFLVKEEGPLGDLDVDGVREAIPNAISCLSTNLHPRNDDLSGVGPGEDITGEEMVSSERSNRLL